MKQDSEGGSAEGEFKRQRVGVRGGRGERQRGTGTETDRQTERKNGGWG